MQAEAESERQARVITGGSERQIAQNFDEAANTYAIIRRLSICGAMNMLYGLKRQNATIVIVPSTPGSALPLGFAALPHRETDQASASLKIGRELR